MIKIIKTKYGVGSDKRTTCRYCGSVLEYSIDDIKQDFTEGDLSVKDCFNFIKCPACTCKVKIKQHD